MRLALKRKAEQVTELVRAYMVDLWLFARRVTPSALAICAVLTVSAVILNHAHAWPEHSLLDCFVKAVY